MVAKLLWCNLLLVFLEFSFLFFQLLLWVLIPLLFICMLALQLVVLCIQLKITPTYGQSNNRIISLITVINNNNLLKKRIGQLFCWTINTPCYYILSLKINCYSLCHHKVIRICLKKLSLHYGYIHCIMLALHSLTSFSTSFNSVSFSLTRSTNVCLISSSLRCNSSRCSTRFCSNVCWKLTGWLSWPTSVNPI